MLFLMVYGTPLIAFILVYQLISLLKQLKENEEVPQGKVFIIALMIAWITFSVIRSGIN